MTTYWEHVKYNGDMAPWTLRVIDNQGFASFSNHRYEAGVEICRELPTVTVMGWHPYTASQVDQIEERVFTLPSEDKEAFYAMANVFPEHSSVAAGIFMTNSFDMTDSPNGIESGMYCAIARLNHSCVPNAQQTHYPDSTEEVLIASRSIEEGQEINDCYIDLRQSRTRRRAVLRELYRFECHCKACDMPENEVLADDMRRVRAKKLDDSLIVAAEEDPYMALDVVMDTVRLLEDPRSLGWSERYLADTHLAVYQIAETLDKPKLMRKHVKQAHSWNVLLQGRNSPASKCTAKLLAAMNIK